MDDQKRAFQERIFRLQAAEGKGVPSPATTGAPTTPQTTTQTSGQETGLSAAQLAEAANPLPRLRPVYMKDQSPAMTGAGNLLFLLKVIVAFMIGALSVPVYYYARHLMSPPTTGGPALPGPNALTLMAFGLGALVLMLVLLRLFRSFGVIVAAAFGVIIMVTGLHNLVHLAPDHWALVMGQTWVDQTIATTTPCTLVWEKLVLPVCGNQNGPSPQRLRLDSQKSG